MIEDDSYRSSSQYRLWSFTPSQLDEHRNEANRLASQELRATTESTSSTNGSVKTHSEASHPIALSIDEEQFLIQHASRKLLDLRNHLDPRPNSTITATAIQYLRRFYLYNSPTIYHPQQMVLVALFTAYKTEHSRMTIPKYLAQVKHSGKAADFGSMEEDDLRALEYLLVQGLRYTFDVRHPMRALDGGVAEIMLRARDLDCFKGMDMNAIEKRVNGTADKVKALLVADVQMTDAYFLYSPPQIYLGALHLIDKDFTTDYITHLFARLGTQVAPIRQKLIDTVTACSQLIASYQQGKKGKDLEAEYERLETKLEKLNGSAQVGLGVVARGKQAAKRAEHERTVESESDEDKREKKAKKRKLQAEKTLDNDGGVFGPEIKNTKT